MSKPNGEQILQIWAPFVFSFVCLLLAPKAAGLESVLGSFIMALAVSIAVISMFYSYVTQVENHNFLTLLAVFAAGIIFILFFAFTYFGYGLRESCIPEVQGACAKATRWDALYFSVVTGTTLGYGDFAPPKQIRLIAALQAIVGYIYLGFFVGFVLRTPK